MAKTVQELAEAVKEAEKDFQFSLASGNDDRIKAATKAKAKAWAMYTREKKKEFLSKK